MRKKRWAGGLALYAWCLVRTVQDVLGIAAMPDDLDALMSMVRAIEWDLLDWAFLIAGTLLIAGPAMKTGIERLTGRQRSAIRATATLGPKPKKTFEKRVSMSRLDWTRILNETGVTEAVYRRLNPDESHPSVRIMEDYHERRVIENKLWEEFLEAHGGAGFESRRQVLRALEKWARQRAYSELEGRIE